MFSIFHNLKLTKKMTSSPSPPRLSENMLTNTYKDDNIDTKKNNSKRINVPIRNQTMIKINNLKRDSDL